MIVAETLARVRQDLPAETALIGFCGSPWTVATYMVGGRGSPDQAEARFYFDLVMDDEAHRSIHDDAREVRHVATRKAYLRE